MTNFTIKLCVLLFFVFSFTRQYTQTELKLISNQALELINTRQLSDSWALQIHFSGIEIGNSTKSDAQNGVWNFKVLNFPNEAIRVTRSRMRSADFATEYTFVWNITRRENYAYKKVCFQNQFKNLHWYSTFLQPDTTYWPMNAAEQDPADNKRNRNQERSKPEPNPGPVPFFTDSFETPNSFGTTIEYLFLNSHGFAIMLDDLHFWTIEQKSQSPYWCISTEEKRPEMDHVEQYKSLKLRILVASDIKAAWQNAIRDYGYIQRPRGLPHEALFKYPIIPVSSVDLGKFVKEIFKYKIKSHIFIDQASVDSPGENENIDQLRLNHSISISLKFPFTDAPGHHLDNNIDITLEGFVSKILQPKWKDKIDWLQFTGGSFWDFSDQNTYRLFEDEICGKYQNFITTRYAHACVQFNPRMVAIECTFKAQALGTFVRVKIDKNHLNAIRRLIKNVLTLSLGGYQFIMPELINFSPYNDRESLDLYKQWLQVVTFLPAMQLPGAPWTYDTAKMGIDMVEYVRECLQIRAEILLPRLVNLTEKWIRYGEPIIRPMWYVDPADLELYTIDNQFMIGDDLLVVAPKGGRTSVVYLPKVGSWKKGKISGQQNTEKIYPGNGTLALDATSDLLYFIKIK